MTTDELKKDLGAFAQAVSTGSHTPEEDAAAMRCVVELVTRFHATCLAVEQIAADIKSRKALLP